jgi:hypothetical protein
MVLQDLFRLCEASCARLRARLEAVLESPGDILEVTHAAGAGGLSSLSLLGPVV